MPHHRKKVTGRRSTVKLKPPAKKKTVTKTRATVKKAPAKKAPAKKKKSY